MAYTPINPLWIVPGQPTKTELFERISDNLDDHESRISTVETVSNITNKIDFEILGQYKYYNQVFPPVSPSSGATLDLKIGIMYERIPIAITALACRLIQYKAGKAGTSSFDIQYSTNNGASFATIFSTPPSVTSANGDYYISSNAVLSITSFPVGTMFRLDLISAQDYLPFDCRTIISLEYEVT